MPKDILFLKSGAHSPITELLRIYPLAKLSMERMERMTFFSRLSQEILKINY
jgi:hypothetical protein